MKKSRKSKKKFNKSSFKTTSISKNKKLNKTKKNSISMSDNVVKGEIIVGTYIGKECKTKINGQKIEGQILPKFKTKLENVCLIDKCKVKPKYGQIASFVVMSVQKDIVFVETKEILGDINDPNIEVTSLIKEYEWPEVFKNKVLEQANKCNKPVSEADKSGRYDFTNDLVITVDGDDTRDFDDAISVIKKEDLYILSVHIADVANYVQQGSAIDKEALKRATSLYLPDRTIPMLPESLSNGICSLNEGENRLTLSCIMEIDKTGDIISSQLYEGIINVSKRMTYNEVSHILEDTEFDNNYNEDLVLMLNVSKELALLLNNKRCEKGSVDFDFPENSIKLDTFGKTISIDLEKRTIAHQIIEEFMLAANETVSKTYHNRNIPFLYRIHDNPKVDKLVDFISYMEKFDYNFANSIDNIKPSDYQDLLKQVKGSEDEKSISRLALRTMSQAIYSKEPLGHFALAKKDYSHFTSPIRRYPDLQIHRIIHDDIRGRLSQEKISKYDSILDDVALHSSDMERRASEIERKVDRMKMAWYMEDYIGKKFNSIISSITEWGFYVELDNMCEGLVHVKNLKDDHYIYMEKEQILIGEKTGKMYRLGDTVQVKLINCNKDLGQLDFKLIN